MHANISVGKILDTISKGVELPTLAPVMKRLVAFTSGEEKNYKSLLKVIAGDPILTLRTLRAANRKSGMKKTVYGLNEAAELIGETTLRSLVLATEFIDKENSSGKDGKLFEALQWVWERSLFNATAATLFSRKLQKGDPEKLRSFGLLLDIGVIFMLKYFTEQYMPVFNRWSIEGGFLIEHEKAIIGVDHTIIGQHLVNTWGLGKDLEQSIRWHHSPENAEKESEELQILHLTTRATGFFFKAHQMKWIDRVCAFGKEKFGIDKEEVANVLQLIALEADQTAYLMDRATTGVSSIELLQIINKELGQATLTYDQMVRELEVSIRKAELLALKLEEANKKLTEAANVDPLTKVYNRRFFSEFLDWNFSRAARYNSPLGCLMIDIDHFKVFNDTYGHLTGDRVLQAVADSLKENLRKTDIISRFGGEEFIVLLPETSGMAVAFTANKLLEAIRNLRIPQDDKELQVTVSIGYFTFTKSKTPEIQNGELLVKVADENMYEAKQSGRNRVWPSISQSEIDHFIAGFSENNSN